MTAPARNAAHETAPGDITNPGRGPRDAEGQAALHAIDKNTRNRNITSLCTMKQNMLITCTSDDSLDAVCARLPEVSQRHKFGVLGTHDLKEKMISKGVAFDRECRIFEVCNPHQAKQVLTKSIEVSTALPCRISVYEEGGKVVLATLKPTGFLSLYEIAGAESTAREVEETLTRIMRESAGS